MAKFLDVSLSDEQVERVVKANTFANIKAKYGNSLIHRKGE